MSEPVPETTELPGRLAGALAALTAGAPGTACFTLLPEPESVTEARRFTVGKLRDWDMAAIVDDVALVVTELVTNALRHSIPALPELPRHEVAQAGAAIRLRLTKEEPWLLCGIFDAGSQPPCRTTPDFIAETGRGLHLVESFTDRWGWQGLPGGGKVVWALFRLP